ncbi:LOW QUALITY PROTEIN: DNA replication ATP-dependent helicase/nuclease JHS1-like [Octopus sinensis]|uniref:DNA replication ATP-dependent helicase/nuclease n=1 Tax=Octopus sinensis TaxID=2607531 RepID=A0A7E6EK71_9MOLL|nr:LOW QUALITY PROTEIN: DNA replication ATP-dependent helicase/nuclease JHS1-like [Octopus sinensis]
MLASFFSDSPHKIPKCSSPEPFLDGKVYTITNWWTLSNGDKVLEFQDPQNTQKNLKTCTLEGFWSYTLTKKGDSVLFIDSADSCRVTDHRGMVVVNPQTLISVTTLSNSHFCLRKTVLAHRFGQQCCNKYTTLGQIVHKLVEKSTIGQAFDFSESLNSLCTQNYDILAGMMLNKMDTSQIVEEINSKYKRGILQFSHKLNSELSRPVSVWVEEDVRSARIGVVGKIDILAKLANGTSIPVEIKSGKKTNSNWLNHSAQVQLYLLLLTQSSRKGGYLYYPLDGGTLTHVEDLLPQQKSLIQSRNQLSHYIASSFEHLPDMIDNSRICSKCPLSVVCLLYSQSTHSDLSHMLGHLRPEDITYFNHWQRLIDIEREEEGGPRVLKARRVGSECSVMFEGGDLMGVVSGTVLYITENGEEWEMMVESVCVGKFTVICNFDENIVKYDCLYSIRVGEYEHFYRTGLGYLAALMEDSLHKRLVTRPCIGGKVKTELNVEQELVLDRILNSGDQFVLVRGCPGSGKTTLLARVVQSLVDCGNTVLVVSHTNSAVDGISRKLEKLGTPFWRFGDKDRMDSDLLPQSFENVVCDILKLEGMKWGEMESLFYSRVLPGVVGITRTWSHRRVVVVNSILSSRDYDWCIVEESCQIMQPLLIGPLCLAKRACLIGDPLQLLPVTRSRKARSVDILILERRAFVVVMQLANHLLYEGRLQCGDDSIRVRTISPNKDLIVQPKWLSRVVSSRLEDSVLFIKYTQIEKSRVQNRLELSIVDQIVTLLTQAFLIHNELKCVESSTIDKYQGREKDVIVISFVRCENDSILNDLRRLTVAVTRARYKLVMVGHRLTLETHYHPMRKLFRSLSADQIVDFE